MTSHYYQLEMDHQDGPGLRSRKYDLQGLDWYFANNCEPANHWPINVNFYVEGEQVEHCLFVTVSNWLIVSAAVQQTFAKHQIAHVQFLPVNVIYANNNKHLLGYSLLHVTHAAEALNQEKSIWIAPNPRNEIDVDYPLFRVTHIALD